MLEYRFQNKEKHQQWFKEDILGKPIDDWQISLVESRVGQLKETGCLFLSTDLNSLFVDTREEGQCGVLFFASVPKMALWKL